MFSMGNKASKTLRLIQVQLIKISNLTCSVTTTQNKSTYTKFIRSNKLHLRLTHIHITSISNKIITNLNPKPPNHSLLFSTDYEPNKINKITTAQNHFFVILTSYQNHFFQQQNHQSITSSSTDP